MRQCAVRFHRTQLGRGHGVFLIITNKKAVLNQKQPSPRRFLRFALMKGVVALFCVFLVLAAKPLHGQVRVPKEYQLKAAFLYNFAKFIQWPDKKFNDANSPIVIGVFGENLFGDELDKAVRGRKVNGREIVVRQIQTVDAASSVHLLFVPAAEDSRLAELKVSCQGASVLVVGESGTFTKRGGAIAFKIDGDNLRFEINTSAAAGAELKVNAQLLKLASNLR